VGRFEKVERESGRSERKSRIERGLAAQTHQREPRIGHGVVVVEDDRQP